MLFLDFLGRRDNRRRPHAARFNCVELEARQLLTTVATPRPRHSAALMQRVQSASNPRLGTPKPAQASPFANLAATPGSPKVFQDAATLRATLGLDGSGFAVALIDTGVDYRVNALGNGFGSGHKVVAGYDFGMNDADPLPTWNHGTAVSGVIASEDPANPGIAPGADIVALRVFDDNGNSTFGRIADALDWVVANHSRHGISVVNISLSDSMNYTLNWFKNDTSHGQRITDAIARLKTLNIPVVAAAGNAFKGKEGMGFTAIVKDTISVTGVDPNTGHIAANAQRLGAATAGANATDIAAPSSGFLVSSSDGVYESVDGTSFAAPIVSGSIVLLQQQYFRNFGTLPGVDQVDSWLKQGGGATTDPITKLSIPQIDLAGALALIPSKPAPPAPIAVNPVEPVAPVLPVVPPAAPPVAVVPIVKAPEVSTPVASQPAPTVRINGQEAGYLSNASGAITIESLQGSVKWTNVQIWTGEAVTRRSAENGQQPAPMGSLSKIGQSYSAVGRKIVARPGQIVLALRGKPERAARKR